MNPARVVGYSFWAGSPNWGARAEIVGGHFDTAYHRIRGRRVPCSVQTRPYSGKNGGKGAIEP